MTPFFPVEYRRAFALPFEKYASLDLRYIFTAIVSFLSISIPGCAPSSDTPNPAPSQAESIGEAWMSDDGTVNVKLKEVGPESTINERLITYKPGRGQY